MIKNYTFKRLPQGLTQPYTEAMKQQNSALNRYKKMYPCKLKLTYQTCSIF